MNKLLVTSLLTLVSALSIAQDGVELMDQHIFVHLMVDEFEVVDIGDENTFAWDIDVSAGGDFHKFWSKTRGEQSDNEPDTSELQLLYSKAILPFWDLQAGIRRDLDPGPDRDWAALAIRGLAPYFFDVEAELFLAEGGQTSLRVRGEYDLLLTQRLILTPELEFVAYGQNEPARLIGSGLGEIEFNVRLRYEFRREIAPYIGISRHRRQGTTSDLARIAGRDSDETVLSLGIRGWF
jgi:copper resistance protein B